jgi:hypothetical protein
MLESREDFWFRELNVEANVEGRCLTNLNGWVGLGLNERMLILLLRVVNN